MPGRAWRQQMLEEEHQQVSQQRHPQEEPEDRTMAQRDVAGGNQALEAEELRDQHQDRGARDAGLQQQIDGGNWPLPQIASEPLCKQESSATSPG